MTLLALRRRAKPPIPTLTPDTRRFTRGTRTVTDLIAPASVAVARDHLRLDHHYCRTLVVTGYPRSVGPGWLQPLIVLGEPIEISMQVHPLASEEMVTTLTHRMVQLQSSRLLAARGGQLADPEREIAYEDAERLRDALQRGDERIFSVSLYLLVRASSLTALDDLTRKVETALAGVLAQSRIAFLEQDEGFRSVLPLAQDRLGVYRNLDTSSLATTFPFITNTIRMDRGVLYGIASHNHAPVVIDPFDDSLDNANLVVFAKSGAGKSYFTKLMALRNLFLGVDFLVIDPEDEYRTLCDAVGGQTIRLSGSSSHHLNPFDLPSTPDPAADGATESHQDPLSEQVVAVLSLLEVMLCAPGASLDPDERAILDQALSATYAQAGITRDPASHHRPAPLLRDLHRVLADLGRSGEAVAARLAARLRRYVDGSLAGLFAERTNVAVDRGFTVFNIQSMESELRPLAIHLISSFVWTRIRLERRPRLLIIDEAWTLLRYPEGGTFLASMARRARKYNLGLVTITQDVADFLDAEAGRTVLANAALKLLLKQDSTTIESVVRAFQLSAEERQYLLGAGKGEGLFFARGIRLALKVEASPAEHRLITTAPRELLVMGEETKR